MSEPYQRVGEWLLLRSADGDPGGWVGSVAEVRFLKQC
jgi:hypothetical protein